MISSIQKISIKIYEKSYKNVLIFYIGYVTIQDPKYVKINSINLFYFIFNKVNGYFEEINGNRYLRLVPIVLGHYYDLFKYHWFCTNQLT